MSFFNFTSMKKLVFILASITAIQVSAQYSVKITSDPDFAPKEAYVYTENGSKDILLAKADKKGNVWTVKNDKPYVGLMKVFFPESNTSLSFISENTNVDFRFESENNKIKEVTYLDQPNQLMDEVQGRQRKKEVILPALYEMKTYYKPSSEFAKAIDAEIGNLSKELAIDPAKNPFVSFYSKNYNRFLVNNPSVPKASQSEIISFLSNSDEKLESSTLLQPILLDFVQNAGNAPEKDIDNLLNTVKVESPRGQVILSELIDIFDAYGMDALKTKYLAKATDLKCTITDRLASTMEANKNTQIGAVFPDNTFVAPKNTTAKKLSQIKANKKVVVFWSSTCSHCEQELPQFIPYYNTLKAKGVEIVGLSLDTDKASYEKRVKDFPWINDSELRGWYSSYGDTYNVHATPTYFILDANNKIIGKPNHIGDVLKELGVK